MTKKPENEEVKQWLTALNDALTREKEFRKEGREILSIYEGAKVATTPFNILYSNTETLSPALYNTIPRPVVDRRFKDDDPTGKEAAQLSQRVLEYLIDDSNPDEGSFDSALRSAVTEGLLPGRGVTRFSFEAEVIEEEPPKVKSDEANPAEAALPEVRNPTVCWKEVPWDHFRHGYAKKWRDVPWISFEHEMTKAELKKNFPDVADQISVSKPERTEGEESAEIDLARPATATVFEIWDKATKTVHFVSPAYKDGFLRQADDPLKVRGFFPIPRPMTFFQKVNDPTPRALYSLYKAQADELNIVTQRIKAIVKAMKIRGFYDSTVEGIDAVINAEDNTLVPINNAAALTSQGIKLDSSIWLMPIEKLVGVLQQLYTQREQCKRTLYEINGIADIMRGASQASETLGAQEIKNQWGGMRLKRMQKEVARYARDCLRMMAELSFEHLPAETIRGMAGSQLPSAQQKAQAQQIMQQVQQTGQEPPPELQQILSKPSLEEVIELLKNDLQRSFRIDIETNSTVDLEATEDKELVGEVLNAMAQFLNGIAPLIEKGFLPFEAARGMLLSIVRRFRFGKELEENILQMAAPKMPAQGEEGKPAEAPPSPEVQAAEAAAAQTKMLLEQQKQTTIQMDMEFAQADHQFKMQQLAAKQSQLQNQGQLAQALHAQKLQQAQVSMQAATHSSELSAATSEAATAKARESAKSSGVTAD
jgi:hypothetical protein